MIQKAVDWYSVKEKKPVPGRLIVVFKQSEKLIIDYGFAVYHDNWDGKEGFIDVVNGEEVRIGFEPDFWAELEFPV